MQRLANVVAVALACSSANSLRQRRKNRFASCGVKGVAAAGHNETGISIVNGENAAECEWKWQVGLWFSSKSTKPFCGGSLIAPDWVLTAAHCVLSSTRFLVVAGDHNVKESSGNEQRRQAKQVIKHPKYDFDWLGSWDFALVQLDRPMDMTACVGTVCLPTAADVAPRTSCWITGWGKFRQGSREAEILQEAPVDTISTKSCHEDYSLREYQLTESMLCAQGRDAKGRITDACQVDSGGPLVCKNGDKWTLYGATSWGWGCGDRDYPGVWARVHKAMGWIKEVMG